MSEWLARLEARDQELKRESWLRAEMWGCGDECECSQPQIVRVFPHWKDGIGNPATEVVWAGAFHSGAEAEEWRAQWQDLKEAMKRYPEARLDEWNAERMRETLEEE